MLPHERKLIVAQLQKRIRKNNWHYLCRHPEIRAFVRVILKEVMQNAPENIYDFTANLFSCDNLNNMLNMVNDQIECLNNLNKGGEWTPYEGEMFFSDTEDGDMTERSQCTEINKFLKFSGILSENEIIPTAATANEKGPPKFYVIED